MTNGSYQTATTSAPSGILQLGPETAKSEWVKSSDGAEHFIRFWAGAIGAPVVIYLHGIEGHSRWFEETALALRDRGISVYAPDRRGAGESKEKRGHAASYQRLVKDIEELIGKLSARHPASPIFLVANCWGAKVALTLAGNLPKTAGRFSVIRGLALTSPAVTVQVDVPLLTKLKIGLNYLAGGQGYFDIPLTPDHFTDNEAYLDYITSDPLRLKTATASFFIESLKLTRASKSASAKLDVPLLVIQSGRDKIVDLEGIKRWFETVNSEDKTLKIFTSAAHSLDFDKEAAQYQDVLASWILERTSRS